MLLIPFIVVDAPMNNRSSSGKAESMRHLVKKRVRNASDVGFGSDALVSFHIESLYRKTNFFQQLLNISSRKALQGIEFSSCNKSLIVLLIYHFVFVDISILNSYLKADKYWATWSLDVSHCTTSIIRLLIDEPSAALTNCLRKVTSRRRNHWFRPRKPKTSSTKRSRTRSGILSLSYKSEVKTGKIVRFFVLALSILYF